MARVLIAGCGYVGTALGLRLAAAGHAVWALRRTVDELPPALAAVAADLGDPATLRELPPADFVFYTAAASGPTDAAYHAAYVAGLEHLLQAVKRQSPPPRRVFFTSSTGVYHQSSGEWVNEDSPTEPTTFTGQRVLQGERLLLRCALPATVVRLGGIYGPGRTRLLDSVRQGTATLGDGDAIPYTNRIHREDCAGALAHLMGLADPAPVYLGVDRDPAGREVVLDWIARALGVTSPTPPREPIRRSNKRCSSQRLLATGYELRYPTFREGYREIIGS